MVQGQCSLHGMISGSLSFEFPESTGLSECFKVNDHCMNYSLHLLTHRSGDSPPMVSGHSKLPGVPIGQMSPLEQSGVSLTFLEWSF